MDIFPKKYDVLLGKITMIIYVILLVIGGCIAIQQNFYYGHTAKYGKIVELNLEGYPALYMIWGTVLLFATLACLAFSNRKYALLWMISCLVGSGILFFLSYYLA